MAPKPPPSPPEKAAPVPVSVVRTQTLPASLYAMPESTTLPDSPSSLLGTWSPYLINHKRRGASLAKTFSQGDAESKCDQPKLPVVLPPSPRGGEPTEVKEPEFAFQQAGNGHGEGDSALEEAMNHKSGMLQKGKGSVTAENEQEQPKFEFQSGSLEALVRLRPVNVGAPKNSESDTFFELQDSMSVASSTETHDTGAHEQWWKPSSPIGTSVGTPGAEFYDACEGTDHFFTIYLLSYTVSHFLSVFLPCFDRIRPIKEMLKISY